MKENTIDHKTAALWLKTISHCFDGFIHMLPLLLSQYITIV